MCRLTPVQVTGAFSNIPSVVKATKDRWALKEWVDDEYEGIVAEIIQRIEEDGGSTTTERLLNELPEKFHVSAISVRAYMQTPRFLVRDGRISLAKRVRPSNSGPWTMRFTVVTLTEHPTGRLRSSLGSSTDTA